MKKRVISAIVMLIIVLPIIWFGGSLFRVGVGFISLLALKEIIDLKKSHNEFPVLIQIIAMVSLLFLVLTEYEGYSILFGITYRGVAILILGLLLPTLFYKKDKYTTRDALYLIGAVLFLGTSFNTMILARMLDRNIFLFLILIPILNDIFALFVGRAFGKHKLIPHVSPNKTIEGSVGGILVGTVVSSLFYHFLIASISIKVILGIIILSIMGICGDLIFSKIKRENDIKDFSNIIPGHGGILDRLDSIIAVMLGYLIIYSII